MHDLPLTLGEKARRAAAAGRGRRPATGAHMPRWWIHSGIVHAAPRCSQTWTAVPFGGLRDLPEAEIRAYVAVKPRLTLCHVCFNLPEFTMSTALARIEPKSLSDKQAYAKELADADLLPTAYRKKPSNVLLAVELGELHHMPALAAILNIDVIEGKPRPSADLVRALVRRAGHRFRVAITADSGSVLEATAWIWRKDDPEFAYTAVWTLDRAKDAGLLSKDVWKKHPRPMLMHRATTEVARMACPEVLMGMESGTAEEAGADINLDDGDTIIVRENPAIPAEDDSIADAVLVDQEPVAQDLQDARDAVKVLADTLGWTPARMRQAYAEGIGDSPMENASVDQLDKFTAYLEQQLEAKQAEATS